MHTLETTLEAHDQGLDLLRDILPWLRDSTGFRGVLRLSTPDRSKTVVITLWADETAMRESAESGHGLGSLAAELAGSTRLDLEDYEITFAEGDFAGEDLAT
jgi:hypothetical protein